MPGAVPIEMPPTGAVLTRAQRGDAEAFAEIYRTYATRLLRQAMALCGNPSLAEELAQDTLVEAWKSLHRYHGRCHFFTWLCAILLHRYHNELRRSRWIRCCTFGKTKEQEIKKTLERLACDGSGPSEAAELEERAALVRQCIQALPAKHQQVIFLRFFVDNSIEGIAAALRCSPGTVKSRLFHALDKLRGMKALHDQDIRFATKG